MVQSSQVFKYSRLFFLGNMNSIKGRPNQSPKATENQTSLAQEQPMQWPNKWVKFRPKTKTSEWNWPKKKVNEKTHEDTQLNRQLRHKYILFFFGFFLFSTFLSRRSGISFLIFLFLVEIFHSIFFGQKNISFLIC